MVDEQFVRDKSSVDNELTQATELNGYMQEERY